MSHSYKSIRVQSIIKPSTFRGFTSNIDMDFKIPVEEIKSGEGGIKINRFSDAQTYSQLYL